MRPAADARAGAGLSAAVWSVALVKLAALAWLVVFWLTGGRVMETNGFGKPGRTATAAPDPYATLLLSVGGGWKLFRATCSECRATVGVAKPIGGGRPVVFEGVRTPAGGEPPGFTPHDCPGKAPPARQQGLRELEPPGGPADGPYRRGPARSRRS